MTNASELTFGGFMSPEENWSRLPHALIDALPIFTSLAELKIVLYILRHTWGFKEFDRPKHLTLDELQHGRKREDGSRMDNGTGMVKSAVIDGVKKATEHGFLTVLKNDQDKGRKERHYALKMFGSQTSDVAKSNISGKEVVHRTEKETSVKKPEKETDLSQPPSGGADAPPPKPDSVAAFKQLETEQSSDLDLPLTAVKPKDLTWTAVRTSPPIARSPSPGKPRRTNVPSNPVVWLGGGRYVGPFKSMAAARRYSAGHGTITDRSAVPAGATVEAAPDGKPKDLTAVKPKDKPKQPPQYGDVFKALVECYWLIPLDAAPPVTKDRAGKVAKALLRNFPDATADEVCRSAKAYRARGDADMPIGETTMPDYFARWRANGSSRTVLDGIDQERRSPDEQNSSDTAITRVKSLTAVKDKGRTFEMLLLGYAIEAATGTLLDLTPGAWEDVDALYQADITADDIPLWLTDVWPTTWKGSETNAYGKAKQPQRPTIRDVKETIGAAKHDLKATRYNSPARELEARIAKLRERAVAGQPITDLKQLQTADIPKTADLYVRDSAIHEPQEDEEAELLSDSTTMIALAPPGWADSEPEAR